jgi:hypothetical protein
LDDSLHKYYYVSNHGHVWWYGVEFVQSVANCTAHILSSCTTCCSAVHVHAMIVATESKNIRTKFENVRAKLIVYGHFV